MSPLTRQVLVARTFLAVFVVALAPANVRGQTPAVIGSRVVVKGTASLRIGEKTVDLGKAHHIYTVEKVNGDWFWLAAGAVRGWAQKSDVLTLDQAVVIASDEIKRNPDSATAYCDRGVLRHNQREFDRAIDDYTEALKHDPNSVVALFNRGNAHLAKNEPSEAVADYTRALQLDPKDAHIYLNRSLAWHASKEYDKAIADYDEVIRLGAQTPTVYRNRGHLWALKHDLARAIADYDEEIRLTPRSSLAYVNRGSAYQAKGDFASALADYAAAIDHDPRAPWGYAASAWLLATCPDEKLRDGKKAVALATKACELGGSKNSYLCEVCAAAHAEAGNFNEAVNWQTKAIEAASALPGSNVDGDRARLQLYHSKKPYRLETAAPAALKGGKPGA